MNCPAITHNSMIKKIIQIFDEIFLDPMPLKDFSDYDNYWEKREKQEPKYRFVWVAEHLPIRHLPEPELLMNELLKTRAKKFYITIPNLGFIVNRLRLALGGKMPITAIVYHIKEHLRFWTVRDFHQWADHCGFKVERYAGQNGFFGLWRIYPSLFARQMIYVLERKYLDGETACLHK